MGHYEQHSSCRRFINCCSSIHLSIHYLHRGAAAGGGNKASTLCSPSNTRSIQTKSQFKVCSPSDACFTLHSSLVSDWHQVTVSQLSSITPTIIIFRSAGHQGACPETVSHSSRSIFCSDINEKKEKNYCETVGWRVRPGFIVKLL